MPTDVSMFLQQEKLLLEAKQKENMDFLLHDEEKVQLESNNKLGGTHVMKVGLIHLLLCMKIKRMIKWSSLIQLCFLWLKIRL